MNIFFLDRDHVKAAEYHCDSHVVKMAIEYAQLLSTAIRVTGGPIIPSLYKETHVNHPCAIWSRQSLAHWEWLWRLGHNVGNEFTRRYGKIHKSTRILRTLPIPHNIPDIGWLSDPPQAMPEEYQQEDTVKAYRAYYINEKKGFAKWRNGKIPFWFIRSGEKDQ